MELRHETVRPAGAPVVPMRPMPPSTGGSQGSGNGSRSGGGRHNGGHGANGSTAEAAAGQVAEVASQAVEARVSQAGHWAEGTASDLREIAGELRDRGREGPARIAEMASEGIAGAGRYMQDSDTDHMAADLREFARRQPVAFAVGAAITGLVIARVVRAATIAGRR